MTVSDELRKQGYKLEYECGNSEDRTEVWINEELGMAVRIEWMPPLPPAAHHRNRCVLACARSGFPAYYREKGLIPPQATKGAAMFRRTRVVLAIGVVAAFGVVVLAGDGFGFKCENKDCGFKPTVVFGGGMLFHQATGWCHKCAKFQAVQWTRQGAPLDPNGKVVPEPQPLAEVWNPASGEVQKVYKCPGCGGGFMEIRKPGELTHCPKCSKPGFKVDPNAPRLAVD